MNIRTEFDDFKWARGRYTLSPDRLFVVRDPTVKPEPYTPDGETLKAVASGVYEEDTALALVQRVGFLTVAADAPQESVAACVMAAGELVLDVTDFPMPIPEPANLPKKWAHSMDRGGIGDEIRLSDGRVLTGAAKKDHELRAAQSKVWTAHEQHMKANPPRADWVRQREDEMRAARFNARAQLRVRATIEFDKGSPELVLRPFALRDWCWYRRAGSAAGTVQKQKCQICDTWFDVDLTDGRKKMRLYCSPACKAKGFRRMKKPVKAKRRKA